MTRPLPHETERGGAPGSAPGPRQWKDKRGAQLLELVELQQAAPVCVVLAEQPLRLLRAHLEPHALERAAQLGGVELAAAVVVELAEGLEELLLARGGVFGTLRPLGVEAFHELLWPG